MSATAILELVAGAAIIGYVFSDFMFTTIGTNVYSFVSHRLARGLFALNRQLPDWSWKYHAVGPLCMGVVALWWVAGLWLGWTLVLHSFEPGVVRQDSEVPATFFGTLSHAGHMLSTLGGGISMANGIGPAILGVLAAVTGMVVLTLSVSFILSTTQTVVSGRSLLTYADAMREQEDDLSSNVLPQVASLVCAINSAPFALFYSHPDPRMRLPGGLARLYRRSSGETREAMDRILARFMLIGEFDGLEDLERWAERYDISKRAGGTA